MRGQMDPDYFPVALGELASTLLVHELRGNTIEIRDVMITTAYLNHPGMNLGYRIAHGGKTLVDSPPQATPRQARHRLAQAGAPPRHSRRPRAEERVPLIVASRVC